MDRKRLRFGLAVLLACMSTAVVAAPRSIKDCAGIDNAFAYNQCLASFGPKIGQQHYQPDGEAAKQPVHGRHRYAAKAAGSGVVRRAANGRFVAEFQIGERAPQPVVHWYRHRRHR